jgi:GNAT superfamily N-acetyltransferase
MEELDFIIKYSFSSFLKDYPVKENATEFVNEINFEVYLTDEAGNLVEQVGKGKISQILFSLAMDSGFPLMDVMDATHSICQMSGVLFEWDKDKDFWDKIDTYFDYFPLENYNVFFLESIEVIAKYRGKDLGDKIINNLIESFYSSCGLWVLKAFPIQHDISIKSEKEENQSDWNKKMEYQKMESDFEKSQYQLFNYYKKRGFKNPFDMEYFIARPSDIINKSE